jgi:uncharacterized protein YbaR (Trm112 family)
MKKNLMEILACPIDKHHPLKLIVLKENKEIIEGLIICPKCKRYYPIIEDIPRMLPDELRSKEDDLDFIKKWKEKIPSEILYDGKPFNLSKD